MKHPKQSKKNNRKEKPLVLSVGMTPVNPIMTTTQRIPRKPAVQFTEDTVCPPPVQEVPMDTQEEFITLNDLLSMAKNRCKTIPTEVVVGNIPPQKRGAEKGLILIPDTHKVPATQAPVPPVANTVLVLPVKEKAKKSLYISMECGTPYIAERPHTPGDKVYQHPDKLEIKKFRAKFLPILRYLKKIRRFLRNVRREHAET